MVLISLTLSSVRLFDNAAYTQYMLPERYYDEEYMEHYISTLLAEFKIFWLKKWLKHHHSIVFSYPQLWTGELQISQMHIRVIFTLFKFRNHFFRFFAENEKRYIFHFTYSITYEPIKNWNVIPFLRKYLSYNYTKFQANLWLFDTQKACLKKPCIGDIR